MLISNLDWDERSTNCLILVIISWTAAATVESLPSWPFFFHICSASAATLRGAFVLVWLPHVCFGISASIAATWRISVSLCDSCIPAIYKHLSLSDGIVAKNKDLPLSHWETHCGGFTTHPTTNPSMSHFWTHERRSTLFWSPHLAAERGTARDSSTLLYFLSSLLRSCCFLRIFLLVLLFFFVLVAGPRRPPDQI